MRSGDDLRMSSDGSEVVAKSLRHNAHNSHCFSNSGVSHITEFYEVSDLQCLIFSVSLQNPKFLPVSR